ncbi:hypothetical protein AO385_1552 [Moraxella catarrhalis]|uniref:Uncharacterized protein n=1 Tax=Moraxella catarrhalis TaxID=480 RepID=A0A198UE68_MORCA|nr:hypothetical protein AO383_2264 [Moraxella catarrhalis]OAU94674.1 hypothetical protein AO384_2031 [Moraxella catarrhalis]OAU98669.1 hypothetical protein AO385_1552 [Moraxella catarrhalis]
MFYNVVVPPIMTDAVGETLAQPTTTKANIISKPLFNIFINYSSQNN